MTHEIRDMHALEADLTNGELTVSVNSRKISKLQNVTGLSHVSICRVMRRITVVIDDEDKKRKVISLSY